MQGTGDTVHATRRWLFWNQRYATCTYRCLTHISAPARCTYWPKRGADSHAPTWYTQTWLHQDMLRDLEKRSLCVLDNFNPQAIANTLWAFAKLGLLPSEVMVVGLTARAVGVRGDINPHHISNMLWAFATLGLQPSKALIAGLTAQALVKRNDFGAQGIANTLWAFAKMGLQPSKALIAGLTAQALVKRNYFEAQGISMTLWAFATLGLQPSEELLAGLTAQAVKLGTLSSPRPLPTRCGYLQRWGDSPAKRS